jgi:hypothetical protein
LRNARARRVSHACRTGGDDSRLAASSKPSKNTTKQRRDDEVHALTYRDPTVQLDPEQRAAVPAAVTGWCEEMDARGIRLDGHVLGPLTETRTVRSRDGETTVDHGTLSEQNFQIAGFNVLECADIDEAIEVASKNPGANFGVLELRPIEP